MLWLLDLDLPRDWSFLAEIVVALEFVLELRFSVDPSPSVTALAGFLQFYVILLILYLHIVDRNYLSLVAFPDFFAFLLRILVKLFLEGLFCTIWVGIADHLLAYFWLFLVLYVSVPDVGWFPASPTAGGAFLGVEMCILIVIYRLP